MLLRQKFGLDLVHPCGSELLGLLDRGCTDLVNALAGAAPAWMQGLQIRLEPIAYGGLTSCGIVRLNPTGLTRWTIVHELAHAWDFSTGLKLSREMKKVTHSWNAPFGLHKFFPVNPHFWYHVGSLPPPCGTDKNFNALEDFAESVAAYVYPDEAFIRAAKKGMPYSQYGYEHFYATPRGHYIHQLTTTGNKNALD